MAVARGSAISGVIAALFVGGTLIYAVAAQMTEPPLEPARTFIDWQALWRDGTYGVKATFLVTWTFLLFTPLVPFAAVTSVVNAITAARTRPAMPEWPRIEWARMREPARAGIGAALTLFGVVFGGVCLFEPELLVPVGYLATLALMVWPFSLLLGPLLLLDAAMPADVVVASIQGLDRTPGASPQHAERFHVRVGEKRLELGEAAWRQLAENEEIAVRSSSIFSRVLELRRRAGMQ